MQDIQHASPAAAARPAGEQQVAAPAGVPMDNPYCSCKLTRAPCSQGADGEAEVSTAAPPESPPPASVQEPEGSESVRVAALEAALRRREAEAASASAEREVRGTPHKHGL